MRIRGILLGYIMRVKYIKGFDKFYCISDSGKIWSKYKAGNHHSKIKKGKWKRRKLCIQPSGHLTIVLYLKGKQYSKSIHSLVLETFIGPCPLNMQCRHLDGDPTNNKFENLKWGTSKENGEDMVKHGTGTIGEKNEHVKLTENEVIEIREMYSTNKYTQEKLAEIFDVTQSNIGCIIRRKSWKHI